jgi:hypothetical protein
MGALQSVIVARVHGVRPKLRHLTGDRLLENLMESIANDGCQMCVPEPCESGYVDDPASVKALRFLLRCMEAA